MKIVVVSDTHGRHNEIAIPDGDILIHCGDALKHGSESNLIELNEWFGDQKHPHKIYVPGNHDWVCMLNQTRSRETLTNVEMLIDQAITIEGLSIYGTPWTPQFYNWAFMKADKDLAPIFEKIPEALDILVSHGPPFKILDVNISGENCGSHSLLAAIQTKKPKISLFGHIHECHGDRVVGDTHFYNASSLDERYWVAHKPIVIDIMCQPLP